MAMYIFPSFLSFIAKYTDDLTPNLSSSSGKPHVHLKKFISKMFQVPHDII